ncbi:MAG: hypothetical protein KY469_10605 [Actinobacteria bacterium]|nr:hypothetical protein [Actinomycetota bacterium]
MRGLSLWQPRASLMPLGVKRIETRSWSTSYRGPVVIHAAKRRPEPGWLGDWLVEPWYYDVRHVDGCACDGEIDAPCARRSKQRMVLMQPRTPATDTVIHELPFGAAVARGELVDVLPIVASGDLIDWSQPYVGWWSGRPPGHPEASLHIWEEDEVAETITDQAPYGDFTPGRFAWMFEDVESIDPPVPMRGYQGLWRPPADVAVSA